MSPELGPLLFSPFRREHIALRASSAYIKKSVNIQRFNQDSYKHLITMTILPYTK